MRQRYIQSFAASGDVQTALEEQALGKPYVAYLEDAEKIDWDTLTPIPPGPDYSQMPLTFEILGAGDVSWTFSIPGGSKTIEYSLNGGPWTSINSNPGVQIGVDNGDIIQFRGDNATYADSYRTGPDTWAWDAGGYFGGSYVPMNVKGNIMSLIDSTNFSGLTSFSAGTKFNFISLFNGCDIRDASNLVLPVASLTEGCYKGMFYGNYNLNYVKCLATDISATDCTDDWLGYVSGTGTFVKHPNTTWPTGTSGIPDGWTVIDADI